MAQVRSTRGVIDPLRDHQFRVKLGTHPYDKEAFDMLVIESDRPLKLNGHTRKEAEFRANGQDSLDINILAIFALTFFHPRPHNFWGIKMCG